MAESPRHSVSVAGIVVDHDGNVLVVKRRDNGEWQPPGGILELNETIEEGLRREILEETGVQVSVGPVTGIYKNMRIGVIAIVALCLPTGGQVRATDEAQLVRWMVPSEASTAMRVVFAARMRDALQYSQGAVQRSHDGTRFVESQDTATVPTPTVYRPPDDGN